MSRKYVVPPPVELEILTAFFLVTAVAWLIVWVSGVSWGWHVSVGAGILGLITAFSAWFGSI